MNKQKALNETKSSKHLEYLLCHPILTRAQTTPSFATFSAQDFFFCHLTDGKDFVNFSEAQAGPAFSLLSALSADSWSLALKVLASIPHPAPPSPKDAS